jgi:hypothetical protein
MRSWLSAVVLRTAERFKARLPMARPAGRGASLRARAYLAASHASKTLRKE